MPDKSFAGSRLTIQKRLLSYAVVLLFFAAGIWTILQVGSRLNANRPPASAQKIQAAEQPAVAPTYLPKVLNQNLRGPLSILLLQLIVIVAAARILGRLFVRLGQPPVIGEIIAGILLGPSLLGWLSPSTMAFLFPAASIPGLQLLSQLGVILFMFVVGMELNAKHLREQASAAIMVSHASIIIPFFLGTALSLLIYRPLASPLASFTAFSLFMGIAMSITAFPVLARIIEDRGMSKSPLGSTAIACAAVDDVTAWCLLAVVVAIAGATGIKASLVTIALTILFIGAMLLLKPRIGGLIGKRIDQEKRSRGLVAGVVAFVLACAWFTEIIGIHSLFGAFLAGVVMPSAAGFRTFLRDRLETFGSAVLLPLFFAFTGLRTQINLLSDWNSWLMCLLIIAVAIAGKLVGSMLMARWTGMSWHDSFSIGILMNTRGLMELVVLNIGYELGILSEQIFAMMIVMALATTAMTGPLLSLAKTKERDQSFTGLAAN